MFITLMEKTNPVCDLEVHCLSLAGIIIRDYRILDEEKMPFLVSRDKEKMKSLFCFWLENRVIPNSYPDLDAMMLDIYNLEPYHYGRMYEYQYIGAFLSYMTSTQDSYWVNPKGIQFLSYALIDPYFKELYAFKPSEYEKVKSLESKFQCCLRYPCKKNQR